MGRFYGSVGYVDGQKESAPGVWIDNIIEKTYFGDVIKNAQKWQPGEGVNDNLVLANQISIVADPYAHEHLHAMRYIKMSEAYWKVTNIDINGPRLILTTGGVYNGETFRAPSSS